MENTTRREPWIFGEGGADTLPERPIVHLLSYVVGIPPIVALLAAIGSFNPCHFGMILAMVAFDFGIIGVVMSLPPAKRGEVMSTFRLVPG